MMADHGSEGRDWDDDDRLGRPDRRADDIESRFWKSHDVIDDLGNLIRGHMKKEYLGI